MKEANLSAEERERYIRLCQAGHAAAMKGQHDDAHFYFRRAVELYPFSTNVWLWLAKVVTSRDDRRIALENVLAINPDHEEAFKRLEDIRRGGEGI
jgi:hypothetical protein